MDQNYHSSKRLYECFINLIITVYKEKNVTYCMFSFYASSPERVFLNVSVGEEKRANELQGRRLLGLYLR